MAKFVKPSFIADAESKNTLLSFSFDDSCLLPLRDIWIGFQTKQLLSKLLNDGDITEHARAKFLAAAKAFLVKVATYLQKWCPINDEVLVNAEWLDFDKRQQKTFMEVEFFVNKFPHLFQDMDMDILAEQFMAYQVLPDAAIPLHVKTDVGLDPNDPYRVDTLWAYLGSRRVPGTNRPEFELLFKVATTVLTIPHSNASEERIFSLINKNKTSSRSSLLLEGTLSSNITIKTHIADPLNWKPSEDILKKAKKATIEYNRQHRKK